MTERDKGYEQAALQALTDPIEAAAWGEAASTGQPRRIGGGMAPCGATSERRRKDAVARTEQKRPSNTEQS